MTLADRTEHHLLSTVGAASPSATRTDIMHALAQAAREQLSQRWVAGASSDQGVRARRVNYLSMEFLMGRAMGNALDALGATGAAAQAARSHSAQLEELASLEPDAALGNGGLGRLAACLLDSMATLGLPSFGYGIRYEFGMFAQSIQGGRQVERPDPWLQDGTPWEFPRASVSYPVRFGGEVQRAALPGQPDRWVHGDEVSARAYDLVVPGHGTERVSTLRLWKATAPAQIDLQAFNSGDYARAAEFKNQFENISWVLYPNDSTEAGRELRLRQEFFFTSASLQDILARHLAEHGTLANVAEFVAVHLNDTHPAIGVAEWMRLLVDEHGWPWAQAWACTTQVFSYTNHTLMPEALETWAVALMQRVLPRHMDIIYRINHEFLSMAAATRPGDNAFMQRMSLIDERGERRVRMAHLAVVGSHKVNGVSALHSDLLVQTIFADFASLWPERFINVTNGVTPRRWLAQANPGLANLLDETLGKAWRLDLDQLSQLRSKAADPAFRSAFLAIKLANKERLAAHIAHSTGITVDPRSLFDVQVKRIHEYKRQLLNVLHVVARWQALAAEPAARAAAVPRTVIFAGKAASAYHTAKLIVQLMHDVAKVVNSDPRVGDKLKLVFLPNYGVSLAEAIIPAADLSEQISTAGTEASGTGNMKFGLNGALTIGTWDGANIEMGEAVGEDNMFVFGLRADAVATMKSLGYDPRLYAEQNKALRAVLDAIGGGQFSPGEPGRYRGLIDGLLGRDHYMLLADFDDYLAAQSRVDALYREPASWARMALANIAGMGPFSVDRTIGDYLERVWR